MALTRGDKMIILGAVALAATVVLGLAILKRPGLFSGGGRPAAAIAPAPTAATSSPPVVAAPVAPPPAMPAPSAQPAQSVQPVAQAPAAMAAAQPAAPATGKGAPPQNAVPGPQAGSAPSPTVPATPGDANLERMFAEMSGTAKPADKPSDTPAPAAPQAAPTDGPKAALPAQVEVAQPPSGEPEGVPAPTLAPVVTKADGKVPPATAKPAKGKKAAAAKAGKTPEPGHAAAAKPAAAPAKAPPKVAAKTPGKAEAPARAKAPAKGAATAGRVIRVIGEEKPGVYELVIQTTKPPAGYTKMFLTNPPRMVLDIAGSWDYHGASASDTGGGFVRRIRIGRHGDLFRVVLDMSPDAPSRLRGAPTVARVPEGVALRIPK